MTAVPVSPSTFFGDWVTTQLPLDSDRTSRLDITGATVLEPVLLFVAGVNGSDDVTPQDAKVIVSGLPQGASYDTEVFIEGSNQPVGTGKTSPFHSAAIIRLPGLRRKIKADTRVDIRFTPIMA